MSINLQRLKHLVRGLLAAMVLLMAATSVAHAAFFEDKKIVVKDLAFGEVLYDFYQGNYFSATVKLEAAKALGRLPHHEDEAELMLGGLYLSYGMHLEAEAIFKKLIAKGASPEIHDKAWFNLAKVRYQKGLYEDAIRAIEEIGGSLPQHLKDETDMMMANLLMARGQYNDAVVLLQKLLTKPKVATYARYNLGVAMYRNDKKIEGAEQLDLVGRAKASGEEDKALKDKANIALGYALLSNQDSLKAKAYFQRVRINGPFSNKALLGLGWANAMEKDYQKAIVPWMALAKRDKTDSSVYESMLALAYGLEQLKAYPQSMQSYQNAISVFQGEMTRLDGAIKAIREGQLWEKMFVSLGQLENQKDWRLSDLPPAIEARYLTSIISSHEFHEAIKNIRDLKFLRANLNKWANDMPTFKNMLALRRETYENRLPQLDPDQATYRLAALKDERNLYKEEMDRIEREGDLQALATDKERGLIARLDKIKETLRVYGSRMEPAKYDEIREKYRIYRGLLEWDIGTTIKPRQWKIKKALRDLDRELARVEQHQKKLERARVIAPKGFEGYGRQIDFYSKRITQLQQQVNDAYETQKHDLEALLVAELSWVKHNLSNYLDQARFAVARLQDQASQASETQGSANQP
jgi:hypothetical protein